VLYIDYQEAITRPAEVAAQVNAFMEGRLDEQAMAASIDPDLYRTRGKPAQDQ
jgi:hypothetical protein